MSDYYIGEVRMFAGLQAPGNWLFCEGQELAITAYQALYSLIGTAYGGNGTSTFKLPDFRGRVPVGKGQGAGLTARALAATGGENAVTLLLSQMPAHTHPVMAGAGNGTTNVPGTGVMLAASGTTTTLYTKVDSTATSFAFKSDVVGYNGAGVAHSNIMVSTGVNFIICYFGTYPSRA